MADINLLVPFILKWEGGFVNDPNDLGGPTNGGVTLKTWKECGYDKNNDGIIDEEDLKQIFRSDLVECVLKPHYWDRWQASRIRNQSVANLLVDWVWTSGTIGIKTPQRLLNLQPDGVVGEKTLAAVNNYPDQKELFDRLKAERAAYIEKICEQRPANRSFKKGWLNRLNDIKFSLAVITVFLMSCLPGCKSVSSAENTRFDKETVVNSEKESEELIKSQSNRIFSRHADSEETDETITKTITVRFDTSLTPKVNSAPKSPKGDFLLFNLPIKEISKTVAVRGKAVRRSVLEDGGLLRTDSTIVHNTESAVLREKANILQKTDAVSIPYHWMWLFVAPVILLIGFGWFIKRKITDFFS